MPKSWVYYIVLGIIFVALFVLYIFVINKDFIGTITRKSSNNLKQVKGSNLENSRWMNDKEKKKLFKVHRYSELANVKKDGIPVTATLDRNEKIWK